MMAAPVKDSLVMNENDLKSTLMNQKLRAEQHRSNYETLKAQHILLQKVKTLWWYSTLDSSVSILSAHVVRTDCIGSRGFAIGIQVFIGPIWYDEEQIWGNYRSIATRERWQDCWVWTSENTGYPPFYYHGSIMLLRYIKVLTEQKLDVIKLRVAEEIEAPYRKVKQLNVEWLIMYSNSMYNWWRMNWKHFEGTSDIS